MVTPRPTNRERRSGREVARAGLALSIVASSIGASACTGRASAATCLSERTISRSYNGDNSTGVTSDGSTWRLAIVAATVEPHANIVVGFETPGSTVYWHDSKPVAAADAATIALKIGPGAVRFSTQYEAASGSAVCTSSPATTFSPEQPLANIPATATYPSWLRKS